MVIHGCDVIDGDTVKARPNGHDNFVLAACGDDEEGKGWPLGVESSTSPGEGEICVYQDVDEELVQAARVALTLIRMRAKRLRTLLGPGRDGDGKDLTSRSTDVLVLCSPTTFGKGGRSGKAMLSAAM